MNPTTKELIDENKMTASLGKSSWSINYENEFPVITTTDVLGKVTIIDVNEIVSKERLKNLKDKLELIRKVLK